MLYDYEEWFAKEKKKKMKRKERETGYVASTQGISLISVGGSWVWV